MLLCTACSTYNLLISFAASEEILKYVTWNTDTVFVKLYFLKLYFLSCLVFSGKLKSPKWKNFKGIQVGPKDKIRLNNLIWREWHMQCKYLFLVNLYATEVKIVFKIVFCLIILFLLRRNRLSHLACLADKCYHHSVLIT